MPMRQTVMSFRKLMPWIAAASAFVAPAAFAQVNVSGTFNGAPIPTPCVTQDAAYGLGTGQFNFTCNGLSYTCSAPASPAQWINYQPTSNPRTLQITCANGTAVGLQVDIADFDGTRSYCVAGSQIAYDPRARRFNYMCGTEQRTCYPNTPINFDVSNKIITIAQCSTTNPVIFADSLED
jgi:hypothetical protein